MNQSPTLNHKPRPPLTEISPAGNNAPERGGLTLRPENTLDLSAAGVNIANLDEEQKQHLTLKLAEMRIENASRMDLVCQDLHSLDQSLSSIAENTEVMAEMGQAVTITNAREDHLGRTEIMVGTSDAARSGKLTRTQSGENWINDPAWIVAAVLVVGLFILGVIVAT